MSYSSMQASLYSLIENYGQDCAAITIENVPGENEWDPPQQVETRTPFIGFISKAATDVVGAGLMLATESNLVTKADVHLEIGDTVERQDGEVFTVKRQSPVLSHPVVVRRYVIAQ